MFATNSVPPAFVVTVERNNEVENVSTNNEVIIYNNRYWIYYILLNHPCVIRTYVGASLVTEK